MGGILSPLYLSELLTRLEPWVLEHPQGYIYNPPKPSFDKEGFRGHEFSLIGITKQQMPSWWMASVALSC